ncbi:glycoside hydrolase family 5 protein [Catenovulum sp. SX2]|uniref:glycoside hydrolase family 5 protein n=1 Tax=Catenovulum sp. SX2 TaxID=3398614 RepID=UPI003F82E4B7
MIKKIIQLSSIITCLFLILACGGGSTQTKTSVVEQIPTEQQPEQPTEPNTPEDTNSLQYPNYNTNPLAADSSGMPSNAMELAGKIHLGWNIGNTMEALGSETAWGNPIVSDELLQLVKQSGFNAVRIPIAWNQYANQDTAEISQQWLDRVKLVVQQSINKDLYVLINVHWDGGWLENHIEPQYQQAVNAKQQAFWQQIATHLRDFDERLLFASANEPAVETAAQMAVLDSYHQTFVDTVRATGGKNAYRVLVVQGPVTDIEKTNNLWTKMPTDTVADRLMMEVHFYSPFNFVMMREPETWGNPFYYWGKDNYSTTDTEYNPTWGEEAFVEQMFALMKSQFVDAGIPVLLGEYSAMRRSELAAEQQALHNTSRDYYHEFVVEQAFIYGLIPFFWDNGSLDNFNSGIFDRHNNKVFEQNTIDALLRGKQAGLPLSPYN